MRILESLKMEKNSWFPISVFSIFFLLRLPSLFEPYWYGDEGIYQVVGMVLNNGRLLYRDIWDNKPPLLYLLYAAFNSDQFTIRLASFIFGLLSVVVFFLLTKKLFENQKIYFFTTAIFTLMLALPLIEGNIANAENFMMLPILLAAFLVFHHVRVHANKTSSFSSQFIVHSSQFLIAGLLLGLAFLFKVVAIFDLAAFLLFLFFLDFPTNKELQEKKYIIFKLGQLSPALLGFLLPIGVASLFFLLNRAFGEFARAIFFSNIGYVGYGNKLIVPHGLLFIKLVLLLSFVIFLFIKRSHLKPAIIFILLWFAFSLFNAFFAERPYAHYLLTLLPSFVLMIGLIFWEKNYKKLLIIFFIVAFVLILKNFNFYGKTIAYYKNFIDFITGQKTVSSYQAFFDKRTPIDYEIALFIKSKINKNDSMFIWGNNAQVYKLVGSLPPGKYIVAYHIIDYKDGLTNTKDKIEKIKPRFIIIMPDQKPIPLKLIHYFKRISIDNVSIYERFF